MAMIRTLVFSFLFTAIATAAIAEDLIKIKPRDDVFLRMLADVPSDPKAIAVLFPGGAGLVKIKKDGTFKGTKGNFLTRSRKKFTEHGLISVLFDAPSDRRDGEGLTFDYRMGEEHAGDIKKAIKRLRKNYPGLSVWLVGTSRGSTSAANAAANIKDGGPDGIVLTSTVGVSNKHGGNVLDFNLAGIKIPVLVAHHEEDGCSVTPVSGARDIKAGLTASKASELKIFNGGSSGSGNPCKAKSHHGFLEIEQKVVDAIAAWIKSH
ncbi:MAG: alpha/beta hydrolase [Proteobacteria bacterium]|nr:alpha/beta hydrolase [Pseudomonadota bacterium]MDA1022654.1 alpha/beta hydrolase [Pseudomonadota bacterium]